MQNEQTTPTGETAPSQIHIVVDIIGEKPRDLYFHEHRVTPAEIKAKAGLAHDVTLVRLRGAEVDEPANDEEITITNDEKFSVIERIIKVNAREKKWAEHSISFRQVIELFYGHYEENMDYTVEYSRGPRHNPKGTMTDGVSVRVKAGMLFHVTRTHKS